MTSERDRNQDYESAEHIPEDEEEEYLDPYTFGFGYGHVPYEFMWSEGPMHQWFGEDDFKETGVDNEISLDHASEEEWKQFLEKLEKE